MTRSALLALALLGLVASLPGGASACPVPEACVDEVVVCQNAIPMACMTIDPDEVVDPRPAGDLLERLIGPCTCDPIE